MALYGTIDGTTNNQYITCKITWTAKQNTDENYSDVTAKLTYTRTNDYWTRGTWNGSITINGETTTARYEDMCIPGKGSVNAMTSKTVRVYHDSDGTKSITISATGSISASILGGTKLSGTVTLDTIPRASSITSVSDVTLGGQCGVKWTPASSSFAYKVKLSCGGITHTSDYITPGSTLAYTYSATMSVSYWAGAMPTSYTGTCTATLYTYKNTSGELIGTSAGKNFTLTLPSSIGPSVTSFTATIEEGWNGYYIQGKSRCTLTAKYSPGTGSSIRNCSITGPGVSKYSPATELTVTTSVLTKTGNLEYVAIIDDNRSKSARKTLTIPVYEYSSPKLSMSVSRSTSNGAATIIYSTSCSPINSKNTLQTLKIYQRSSGESWPSKATKTIALSSTSASSSVSITGLSAASSYDFKAIVEDTYGGSNEVVSSIASEFRIINLQTNNNGTNGGFAVGKMSEGNEFDCALPARFRDGIEFTNKPHGTYGSFEINQNESGNNILYIRNGDTVEGGDSMTLAVHRQSVYVAGDNNSGKINLGSGSRLWNQVYAANSTISTSDRTVKTDINDMSDEQEQLFNKLQPVTFKFTNGTSGRTHYGFISQDVEDSLSELELTGKDFGGFCKDLRVDENGKPVLDENGNKIYDYALRYSEFIALNTYMIQKLQAENNELKAELQEIKEMIANK